MSTLVWVSQKMDCIHVSRIFKSRRAAFAAKVMVVEMDRALAVSDLRHQLFIRSQGFCELCASVVTEKSGHMHEQKHRGKGGEYSLENSVFICARTHTHEHRDRNPHWSKKT